jgi:hypothetical protein
LNEAKDIQRDFPAWIDSQIPGLDKVKQYPTAKSKLDKAFNSLVAAKNDPTALSAAFDNYVQLATNYTDKLQTSNTQQASNSQSNSQIPGSDAFQQGEQLVHNLPQLGITPEISKKVANALRDRTINKDSLIYAIQKAGRGY